MTAADPTRLGRAALRGLPPECRPALDPEALRTRVVHLGLGAFHRAHQAVWTEQAAARSGEPWGITAVAPRSPGTARALREQDFLYSLTERRPDGAATRVIAALTGALVMSDDAARVDALLADPAVTVVTLTVTEKGYHRRPGRAGQQGTALDRAAPAVAADLERTTAGDGHARLTTVIGRLAAGLAARMRSGAAPVTVVSCDNMADNGAVLGAAVREFTAASGWPDRQTVLDRMAEAVAFPATVVDRIVPATTDSDLDRAAAALGVRDTAAVTGEPYRQWVLEDSFAAPRPPWELDGALFVPDVAPYQLTKLRLLNGSHSALAHLGTAAGRDTVADALDTDWGAPLVRALCAEVAPTLPPGGPDPAAYAADLVTRFSNPAMGHRLDQIAADGSLKLPERWLPALRTLRAAGAATPLLELALAGWVHATHPDGKAADPAAEALAACWHSHPEPTGTVRALLTALGAPDLAEDTALTGAVAARLPALRAGRIEV
ncbi:mannitol dehydrogenase family protein [Streptomyces sp. NBC_01775]|uniref:mannitol dehydrogenase family protein n=1 Tax=Streptomyces sp. NBC_01775 TaxID=2975939 RepID=UPI002DD9DF75|nr:mannitol dehydrogenase family protein [Streptomyces sp. NBC_01775]WSB75116.1 mannitol dehydrogenase family protein [Streptomyces sp. NBC_01775]